MKNENDLNKIAPCGMIKVFELNWTRQDMHTHTHTLLTASLWHTNIYIYSLVQRMYAHTHTSNTVLVPITITLQSTFYKYISVLCLLINN